MLVNTADLTLATGSFEYSNIKDSDRSYNVGGGANIGGGKTDKGNETNYSVNANYGFTDSRQTNFATVGEGTIIVSTSTGSVTGLADGTSTGFEGLKRDVTLAQYNTKEGGLQGGFTVDNATVDLVTHPIDTTGKTAVEIFWGLSDAVDTSVDIYNEAGEVVEKTGNWLENDYFTTDDKVRYFKTMDEYEALKASGGEITPLDTLLYYKSKIAAGEELTQEEIAEYAKVSVIVRDEALKNSRVTEYVADTFNQSVIDYYLRDKNGKLVKAACNITTEINIFVDRAKRDGLEINPEILTPTGEIDMLKVYKLAKQQGDDVIIGDFNVYNETLLARIIAPTSNYELVNGGPVTKDNIKTQLDTGEKIKVTLSDGHKETIYDYETDGNGNVTRFKLDDGGYQGDKYVNPDTMKAYTIAGGKEDIEKNRIYSNAHGKAGTTRDVSKIYIIKDKTE